MYCISRYLYQCYSNNLFAGVVAIAQLVDVTDSAVLGDVVEVVSSIPAVGRKIFIYIYTFFFSFFFKTES